MIKTKFRDVNFKLGYPYVYRHKDHCDHVFIFSEIRLVNNDLDSSLLQSEEGIVKVFSCRRQRQYCEICDDKFAIMAVVYQQEKGSN